MPLIEELPDDYEVATKKETSVNHQNIDVKDQDLAVKEKKLLEQVANMNTDQDRSCSKQSGDSAVNKENKKPDHGNKIEIENNGKGGTALTAVGDTNKKNEKDESNWPRHVFFFLSF